MTRKPPFQGVLELLDTTLGRIAKFGYLSISLAPRRKSGS
jgi:hypothetical protein